MAKEQFNADIELGGHKITQVRIDPMSNADRLTLQATLGVNDKGRAIYDEDDGSLYVWSGTAFTVGTVASAWSAITGKPATFTPSTHTHVEADITDLDKYTQAQVDTALGLKVSSSEKGTSSGVASLDASGKVPASQLPTSVQGDMTYEGSWNANTNTPTLTSSTGSNGSFYRVSVAGTTNIDGFNSWGIGDSLVFNGTLSKWEKFDGNGVASIYGRQGVVTSAVGDYSDAQITNTSTATGVTVKDALDDLDTSKAETSHVHTISEVTNLQAGLDDKLNQITSIGTGTSLVEGKITGTTSQNQKSLVGLNGITISDSSTTVGNVEISGPTPAGSLANSDHGSILNVSNTSTQSLEPATTYKLSSWDSNGPSQQGVLPSFGLGRLTISSNGVYIISVLGSVNTTSAVPLKVTFCVYKNNSQIANFKTTVDLTSQSYNFAFSKTMPVSLQTSDYLEVFAYHDSGLTTSILVSNSVLFAAKQDVANGSATWGNIIGTLSNQTDLQTVLDGKAPAIHTHVEADITDLDKYTQAQVTSLLAQKLNSNLKGTANGVAELDASGRLPSAQLPTSAIEYKGVWNATSNSPTLASSTGTNGDYYLVSVAGTTTLDGITTWDVGDAVVYNGTTTTWQRVGRGDLVTSVHGRVGAITAAVSDYDASQIDNDSSVTGATVKLALDNLKTDVDLNSAKTGITSAQTSAITTNTTSITGLSSFANSVQATTVTNASNIATNVTAIALNTAKVGITTSQASAITTNTAKTGITSAQASAITANTAKTGITSSQSSAITANTAKTGITSGQASAITANTAKTGITSGQASAITANTAKTGITSAQTTKLSNIETSATADQTDQEIEDAYNNQVGAATLAEVQAGSSAVVKRFTPQRVKQAIEYCLPELTKSIFVPDPIATDDFGIWEPGVAITITKIVVQGIGGTSTTFNINHSNGTNLFSSNKVATTTRQVFTSGDFADASCTAENYIQYQASAINGTPTGIKITITYTED